MTLFDYFRSSPKTAAQAKDRLQIVIAHERRARNAPAYLPELQKALLEVVRKFVEVDQQAITVNVEQTDNQEIIELNIVLPEEDKRASCHHQEKRTEKRKKGKNDK